MPARKKPRQAPRRRQPELERDPARLPALGYEPAEDAGLIRCLAHGFPTPLARWHFHPEYELHLITSTSGKAFIGDWIGPFQPGHLTLCGPMLPHNWISLDLPAGGVAERDLVIQFRHEPIAHAVEMIPELAEVLPMLERSRHGIEFLGMSGRAHAHWVRTKQARGVQRLAAFLDFLGDLARCPDYRLLSSVMLQGEDDATGGRAINAIIDRITVDVAQPLSASDMAAELDMSETRFSRFFRRATGNTFTDFVNRARVHRACQLLMDTDRQVTQICYEVGFNNVSNFNRRFLEIKNLTPSEFRRQAQRRFEGSRG
jgi:AraC-like DNA-binding protein